MAMFRCNACKVVYEDYYPPDDSCQKCKKGLIRLIVELQVVNKHCG
jgi:hypothetical protein